MRQRPMVRATKPMVTHKSRQRPRMMVQMSPTMPVSTTMRPEGTASRSPRMIRPSPQLKRRLTELSMKPLRMQKLSPTTPRTDSKLPQENGISCGKR